MDNQSTAKLNEVLSLFYDMTHVVITLFDRDMNPVLDVGKWMGYCLEIGKDENRLAKCRECNRCHAEQSIEASDPIIYTCHAGIGEAVAPLHEYGTLVGYVMIGKFRDTEGKISSRETVSAACEQYGLEQETMLSLWDQLQPLDEKSLTATILLLKIFISYIRDEKLYHALQDTFAKQIDNYISEHIDERITVDSMCAALGLGYHNLYALFKKNFGKSPQEYINEVRLKKAKELLLNTTKAISEIATELGFNKASNFSHFFKDKMNMGITPLQYRKQNS